MLDIGDDMFTIRDITRQPCAQGPRCGQVAAFRALWSVLVTRNDFRVALGRRIRSLRALRAWTQQDLAERTGLARPYVSSLESGDRNVGIDALVKVADAFDLTLAQLVDVEGTLEHHP